MESVLVKDFDIFYDAPKEEFFLLITKTDKHSFSISFDAFDEELNNYIFDLIEEISQTNDTTFKIIESNIMIDNYNLIFDFELFDEFLSEFASACIKRDGIKLAVDEEKVIKHIYH